MRIFKRILCLILIILMLFQVNLPGSVSAAVYEPQPILENLKIAPISGTGTGTGTDRSDAAAQKCYVDLKWDSLQNPPGMPSVNKYINFYLTEVPKPYKPPKSTILKERDVPGSATSLKMRGLSSGTFYYINARAYYTYTDGNTTYTSGESATSNTVKVLTDIEMGVSTYKTNQIKIEWDDVWNSGRRIDYRLYVSDNSSFANTMPIYLTQSQIGGNGPVTVNQATGKLEYIHTVNDPARVYYVKIVPDVNEEGLVKNPSTEILPVSSYILVKTTKMSETDSGTIWRLDWSPVITGFNSSGIDITYQIDKYINDVPIPVMLESGTSTFITVPKGGENNYYVIRANILKDGVPLYPGNIKIVSDKINVKDQEVPSQPPMPELVNEFRGSDGNLIISYDDQIQDEVLFEGELQANSATILWRLPKKADGTVDTEIKYDMWLLTDPNLIDAPPAGMKFTLTPGSQNYVMDGSTQIGYKYKMLNLTPNSTYYVKIIAKKSFVVSVDGVLKTEERVSMPTLKVVVTPTEGPIDQPLVPARPPFKVLEDSIKKDRLTIQLKNKWYEFLDDNKWRTIELVTNEGVTEWKYADNGEDFSSSYDAETITANFTALDNGEALDDNEFRKSFRIVKYDFGDKGVTIDVGCTRYEDGMQMSEINLLPTNKVVGFPVTANDSSEDRSENIDNQKHNIVIPIAGLDPNTTYVFWLRASRQSADLTSGPSDPIIITTDPDDINQVEKPIVPTFNYYQVSDTYADLGWDYKAGYKYYIKYGTVDSINSATNTITTSTQEIIDSGLSFIRIQNLVQNTHYFFWVQAEATSGNLSSKSDWSDSLPLKTLPDIPPNTPRGFGLKNTEGAVTKNEITFEWIREGNLEYILEIASGVDYKDVKEYKVGNISEFKVEGLRSNLRYFARLYTYNPSNKLKSYPTQSVTVRTLRSGDDYDSDEDIENVVSGAYIVKDAAVIKNTWNIKIVGVNADRFVEHIRTDKVLDYRLDATKPPSKATRINFLISGKVLNSLSGLKENLILATAGSSLVIRPEMLTNKLVNASAGDFNYEIAVTMPDTTANNEASNLTFKTDIAKIEIIAYEGRNFTPVKTFNKPLKVVVPYTDSSWYKEGTTSAYQFDETVSKWAKLKTAKAYDTDTNTGHVSFETDKPGRIAVADVGKDYFDDLRGNKYQDSIENVASVHELKSIDGESFQPGKNATLADAVKLALDVHDYGYGSDYMSVGVKAGLLNATDIKNGSGSCTREKAIIMVVRLYELKTGETAIPEAGSGTMYNDMDSVSTAARAKVEFALQNGIAEGRNDTYLGPNDVITRGEYMGMLEKLLVLVGELE